mgnify:CR=1 FL=1
MSPLNVPVLVNRLPSEAFYKYQVLHLFHLIYADRNGGYTRIVKIGQRKGDGAMEVLLELV